MNVHLVGLDVCFYHFLTFIVCNVQGGFVAAGCEGGKNFGESSNHCSVVLGGHSMHKYGVEFKDICNEYVLHRFEEADRERAREVGVHCACVKVGKGSKTKHGMGRADFFAWL